MRWHRRWMATSRELSVNLTREWRWEGYVGWRADGRQKSLGRPGLFGSWRGRSDGDRDRTRHWTLLSLVTKLRAAQRQKWKT